jgi:hypothetical protein
MNEVEEKEGTDIYLLRSVDGGRSTVCDGEDTRMGWKLRAKPKNCPACAWCVSQLRLVYRGLDEQWVCVHIVEH